MDAEGKACFRHLLDLRCRALGDEQLLTGDQEVYYCHVQSIDNGGRWRDVVG